MKRQTYDGVVLTAPVSVPYVRYSQETAHWWIARALKQTLDVAGLAPRELDGFSVSSFTLFPDTPVGLTQHLGVSPRWLDSIPSRRRKKVLRADSSKGRHPVGVALAFCFEAAERVSCFAVDG